MVFSGGKFDIFDENNTNTYGNIYLKYISILYQKRKKPPPLLHTTEMTKCHGYQCV